MTEILDVKINSFFLSGFKVRAETNQYVFIGLINSRQNFIYKIEIYKIDSTGLEVFQGYANETIMKRLRKPLLNAFHKNR
jgi:hypothetical protein